MGCLNSKADFDHWFGNIHLSGPCNRSCYFCIGQWCPGQDMNNNLKDWPIKGLGPFISKCATSEVTEVNITGTNTDPLMMTHLQRLIAELRMSGFKKIGIRTNGVLTDKLIALFPFIDKLSVSITTLDPDLYVKTMGSGAPPDIRKIVYLAEHFDVDVKVNMVLCPETLVETGGPMLPRLSKDIWDLADLGVKVVNLREPYGQPHIGNPLEKWEYDKPKETLYGMPVYQPIPYQDFKIIYWDVHTVEVESINLFADGTVTTDYPVSRGHSESLGEVHPQSNFKQGRQKAQWVKEMKTKTMLLTMSENGSDVEFYIISPELANSVKDLTWNDPQEGLSELQNRLEEAGLVPVPRFDDPLAVAKYVIDNDIKEDDIEHVNGFWY